MRYRSLYTSLRLSQQRPLRVFGRERLWANDDDPFVQHSGASPGATLSGRVAVPLRIVGFSSQFILPRVRSVMQPLAQASGRTAYETIQA